MDKEKKRARVVSPAAVTPEVELEEDDKDEAHHLSVAIEASKAALGAEDLVGLSRQAEVLQDIGAPPEEMKQDEAEEGAEIGPEATLQAQPWRWGVTGEAFEWLGEDLAHLVVPLQPAVFLERMRARAAHMERLLEREREAVWAELMGLRLQYSTLRQSIEMLRDYQEDVTQALEWQEENNVQEDDLLPLCNSSLPSNDD
ncbi:hypothetical protein C0993_007144 [Termitomyces sp. T159_Od127]|nr:hypothetical protein C0993_007144 [Termitomyces sp. T159_Od127]